jgi:hypothetical protein
MSLNFIHATSEILSLVRPITCSVIFSGATFGFFDVPEKKLFGLIQNPVDVPLPDGVQHGLNFPGFPARGLCRHIELDQVIKSWIFSWYLPSNYIL